MGSKIETLLGFAQKAGKIVSGETGCAAMLQKGKVILLIISQDASPNTKAHMQKLCNDMGCESIEWGTKIGMGICIGKSPRATIAVLDRHFAENIRSLIMSKI